MLQGERQGLALQLPQAVVMMKTQRTHKESLRETAASLNAKPENLYQTDPESTLADTNKRSG